MVTLGLGCKVNCADSDFDLSEKNVGHDLLHKVSVIMVKMEILNGWHIVVSCLGLRHEDSVQICLLYTSPSPRDATLSRMPSSA